MQLSPFGGSWVPLAVMRRQLWIFSFLFMITSFHEPKETIHHPGCCELMKRTLLTAMRYRRPRGTVLYHYQLLGSLDRAQSWLFSSYHLHDEDMLRQPSQIGREWGKPPGFHLPLCSS
ncbi:hypothetical protein F4778DRAFT_348349 [Xylariomycetidae sp. FL2044]|nr:hypothetical protein F4778DRAFT_348349 [Xylariomycetidae sp. FL2044]